MYNHYVSFGHMLISLRENISLGCGAGKRATDLLGVSLGSFSIIFLLILTTLLTFCYYSI